MLYIPQGLERSRRSPTILPCAQEYLPVISKTDLGVDTGARRPCPFRILGRTGEESDLQALEGKVLGFQEEARDHRPAFSDPSKAGPRGDNLPVVRPRA